MSASLFFWFILNIFSLLKKTYEKFLHLLRDEAAIEPCYSGRAHVFFVKFKHFARWFSRFSLSQLEKLLNSQQIGFNNVLQKIFIQRIFLPRFPIFFKIPPEGNHTKTYKKIMCKHENIIDSWKVRKKFEVVL